MTPLAGLTSIKAKLSIVIVVAVLVTAVVGVVGVRSGLPAPVCVVLAAAVALGLVQLLARGMTSPLREMATATAAMARGEHGQRVEVTTGDEVGQLARAFNSMSAELEQTDRMRRDLVANVSHELRTPITALQAALENVADGVQPADEETIATMLAQVRRLGRLVSQLLDLSKLESEGVPLDLRDFPVQGMLDQAAREARLHAPTDLTLLVEVEPGDLAATADPERLHQVVANLVENAVRFSPPRGTVELHARREDADVRIEVTDEGPGIPEAERARVFERFYRADAARSGDGGAGLGLAIARWVVDLHGGEIRAETHDPHGCRMVVTLPGPR